MRGLVVEYILPVSQGSCQVTEVTCVKVLCEMFNNTVKALIPGGIITVFIGSFQFSNSATGFLVHITYAITRGRQRQGIEANVVLAGKCIFLVNDAKGFKIEKQRFALGTGCHSHQGLILCFW